MVLIFELNTAVPVFVPVTFTVRPLYLKPLEQNVRMCDCSDTGNMQLPYNSPGGYLVHVLFSQCVYFPINGPGRPSGKPRYYLYFAKYRH